MSFTPKPGTGNIEGNPLFINATANDFHLLTGSPCIGAGEGGVDMGALVYDPTGITPTSLGNIKTLYR